MSKFDGIVDGRVGIFGGAELDDDRRVFFGLTSRGGFGGLATKPFEDDVRFRSEGRILIDKMLPLIRVIHIKERGDPMYNDPEQLLPDLQSRINSIDPLCVPGQKLHILFALQNNNPILATRVFTKSRNCNGREKIDGGCDFLVNIGGGGFSEDRFFRVFLVECKG